MSLRHQKTSNTSMLYLYAVVYDLMMINDHRPYEILQETVT